MTPSNHDLRLRDYLREYPHMADAVRTLGERFGRELELHLCDDRDAWPLEPGQIIARAAAHGDLLVLIDTDGNVTDF